MGRPNINYPHGDSGTRPDDGTDFQADDVAPSETFDWLFDTLPTAIDALSAEFDELDSDGNGVVDAADTANLYKNNDIDSDGDGVVDASDSVETGGSTAVVRDTTNSIDIALFDEGGNIQFPNGDLTDGTNVIYDVSNAWIPQARLENDSLTVAGQAVSLGGSTSIALGNLSNVTASGEGDGNGFDADTVDGKHASDLGASDTEIRAHHYVMNVKSI